MKRAMPREQVSAGRDYPCSENLKEIVEKGGEDGYDFISTYVTHPLCCLNQNNLPDTLPTIVRPDLTLTTSEWSRLIVSKISPWIDVDSPDARIRALSETALRTELSYFTYLCIPAVLIELKHGKNINLAKMINEFVEAPGGSVIWVIVPIHNSKPVTNGHLEEGESLRADADDDLDESNDPWQWYHSFRAACDNKQRLAVVLKITADLPDSLTKIKRWMGEPLKALSIDTSVFLTNDKTFPVLTRNHQTLIKEFYALNLQVLVTGAEMHKRHQPTKQSSTTMASDERQTKPCLYFSYLNHLYKTKPQLDVVSEWALGYEDCLQIPLQPLGDNLESQIYETFEKDPIKYSEYKAAIVKALEMKKSNDVIVIMVLGAGRGPLMTACIEALDSLDVKAKLYAVEKNPNAIVTLNYLATTKWNNRVTVVHSDMRNFNPPDEDKADIIVSELLGSFGDNELSPECLDGALHFMKDDCICIPTSYVSFVAPLHSPKLHQTVRAQAAKESNPTIAYESSYVVRVHNHFLPDEPQELFSFTHPNSTKSSNDRYKVLTFVASESCDLAGLVGYFKATLYDDVELSICPKTHTPGLFSWFPIFFPFKDTVYVKKSEKIVLHFWRCSDVRQVWYEWCLTAPIQTPIMNCKGRSCAIRKV